MNIKTTKKLLIVMAFILAFLLLGITNKVEAGEISLEVGKSTTFKAWALNNKTKYTIKSGEGKIEVSATSATYDKETKAYNWKVTVRGKSVGTATIKIPGQDGIQTIKITQAQKSNTYTLTYDANGGTGAPAKKNVSKGTNVAIDSTKPEKKNAYFGGWYTEKSIGTSYSEFLNSEKTFYYGEEDYDDNAKSTITVNKNITLYAIWISNEEMEEFTNFLIAAGQNYFNSKKNTENTDNTFTIQYFDGDEEYKGLKDSGNLGDTVKLADAPTKEGYTFVEWNTEKDGTGKARSAGYKLTVNNTSEIKYYAQWKKTTASTEQSNQESNTTSSTSFSELFGSLLNFGTTTIPSLLEKGMSVINSETVQSLTTSVFSGFSGILDKITGNSGSFASTISGLLTGNKTNTEDEDEENIEKDETKYGVLKNDSNMTYVRLKEDLTVYAVDSEEETIGTTKNAVIKAGATVILVELEGKDFIAVGIGNYDDNGETVGSIYLDAKTKKILYSDTKGTVIANLETELNTKGMEEKDEYYEYNVGEIFSLSEGEMVITKEVAQSIKNPTSEETNSENEEENESSGVTSDLLNTGIDIVESLAEPATEAVETVLEAVETATGASGITGALKGIVTTAGKVMQSDVVKEAASTGLGLIQTLGEGLKEMFGLSK